MTWTPARLSVDAVAAPAAALHLVNFGVTLTKEQVIIKQGKSILDLNCAWRRASDASAAAACAATRASRTSPAAAVSRSAGGAAWAATDRPYVLMKITRNQ